MLKKYSRPYLAMLVVLALVEYIWFFYVAGDFFRGEVSHVLTDSPKLHWATLFYLFYPVAIIIFVLSRFNDLKNTLLMGAFLGFTVYFVYDITNYVTLFEWSIKLMVVDILWGTAVTAFVSFIGFKFLKKSEN